MTQLRDPFAVVHKKPLKNKMGQVVAELDYVGWSQVADRLDEAGGEWSFQIVQLGEDWCWGRLTLNGRTFENVGYAENADQDWKKEALKDAVSDALKRCAALAGVARYLYDKDSTPARTAPAAPQRSVAPVPTPPRPPTPPDVQTAPHGGWAEGQVHAEGHKPLRARQNGSLYCPTKLPNGAWCSWKHDAAPLPMDEPPAPDWEGLM